MRETELGVEEGAEERTEGGVSVGSGAHGTCRGKYICHGKNLKPAAM